MERDTGGSVAGCEILHQFSGWGLSSLNGNAERQSQRMERPRVSAPMVKVVDEL